ncbi:MAG TPA: alpha/beta hydrolase [Gaiellaceae bacterium]|nr:alpha/beta hydrolase [Gaiellaceae bacterium]
MREGSFELPVDGGAIRGDRGGAGRPALLLHGGAAIPDYLGECAEELDGLFSTIRYTQRGTPPSEAPGPYTIESHMADAIAVLDSLGLERAWAIGHSWGGHLALHLAVAHPERIAGALCISPLGADPSVFDDFDQSLGRTLTPAQLDRIREIDELRRAGEVEEADLVERFALIWVPFFARPEDATPPPARVGVQASIQTNRSIAEHFERGTLARRLRGVGAPVLFVHGEDDPLPPRSSTETAALIPGALVETIQDCGHFPWIEQPAAFRAAVESLLDRIRA